MDVAPFRGIRYAARVGDLARVTAPPYDAIDDDEQRRLHAASPYNVVRLERSLGSSTGGPDAPDRYQRAAAQYDEWRRDGVLVDATGVPAMWVYEQSWAGPEPGHQVGLLVALKLSPFESGDVLPHERVFRGPVEDRKRLLRALPVNVSPLLVLYEHTRPAVTDVVDRAHSRDPEIAFSDADAILHRAWPVTDPAAIASVRTALADEVGLMADGHHRYTTALEYQAEAGAPPGSDRVLAHLVAEDAGPRVRPTHRLVRRLHTDPVVTVERLGISVTTIADRPDPAAAAAALDRSGPAVALVTAQRTAVLEGRRLAGLVPDDVVPAVAALDVTALQHLLLDVLDVPDRPDALRYTPDTGAATAAVRDGSAAALFMTRPLDVATIRAVAAAGGRLPPKATSFVPKPRTGLVLRPLDPERGRPGAVHPAASLGPS